MTRNRTAESDVAAPSGAQPAYQRVLEMRSLSVGLLATLAIAWGIGLRAMPIVWSFPGFDGGFFAAVIDQLGSRSLFPTQIAFNGSQIPFVYPPLAFDVAAIVQRITGAAALDLLRWIPALGAVAVLAAFWLATNQLYGQRIAMLATAIYALMPSAFDRLIAGGGLTRSLGLCFGLLCLASVGRYNHTRRRRWLFVAGALAGLTALSHPIAALLAAVGALFLLRPVASWRDWASAVGVIGLTAFAVALPWLLILADRGQIATLLVGGGQRYQPFIAALTFLVNLVTPNNLPEAIGVIGLFVMIMQHRWSILALVVACVVGPSWFFPTIGLAVCGGAMLADLAKLPRADSTVLARVSLVVVLTLGTLVSALSGLVYDTGRLTSQAAMHWVASHAPPRQPFVVASSAVWGANTSAEWFPYLAQRPSLLTLQGKEWLGPDAFDELKSQYEEMRGCVSAASEECLRDLVAELGEPQAWLLVSRDAYGLRLALTRSSNAYRLVYASDGADVYAPKVRVTADR